MDQARTCVKIKFQAPHATLSLVDFHTGPTARGGEDVVGLGQRAVAQVLRRGRVTDGDRMTFFILQLLQAFNFERRGVSRATIGDL